MSQPGLLIWGASGHARVVADIVRRVGAYSIVGFIDDVNPARAGEAFCGSVVLGGREALLREHDRGIGCLIVAFGDCDARLQCAHIARDMGFELAKAIHPSAVLAEGASVGAGTVVAAGAILSANATVGENVIVNTAASIDHECEIGDGAHLAPGVRLGGRVSIGRGTWIGIGAVVRDHMTIGAGTIVGAGAVVLENLDANVVAYGVPARTVRTLK